MTEHDNDSTSEFFRKALQEPQIRFVESDWEKLEARLDAASMAGSGNHNRWKSAFIVAVALLFVTTGLLVYVGLKPDSIKNKTSGDNTSTNSNLSATPEQEKLSTSKKVEEPRIEEVTRAAQETAQTYANPSLIIKQNQILNSAAMQMSENAGLTSSHENGNKTTTIPEVEVSSVLGEVTNKEKLSSEVVTNSTLPTDSSSLNKKEGVVLSSAMSLKDSVTGSTVSKTPRWNVMLSYAPDFSSTDMHRFTSPGKSFGVSVYFNLSKTLSLSVGALKSNKIYWDNGSAYHPVEAGFWGKKTNGVIPEKIEGYCNMLEIPFGVQYYLASTKKNKAYLAASFSSYIMLKESYQYEFDTPNPGAAESWQARKASHDLFSVATLSAGFERKIYNRVMIGLSPYVKIPLSGIGAWADVKLYSVGAAFTLRYQFQKMKKSDRLIPAD